MTGKSLNPTSYSQPLTGHRLHARHMSPSVDRVARVIMAVIGGVLLLVLIVTLSFLENDKR